MAVRESDRRDFYDFLDAASELAATGHPYLAHGCAEEAAARTTDPAEAARILAEYPDPHTSGQE